MDKKTRSRLKKQLVISKILVYILISASASICAFAGVYGLMKFDEFEIVQKNIIMIALSGVMLGFIGLIVSMYNITRSMRLDIIKKELYRKRQNNHLVRSIGFLLKSDYDKCDFIVNRCMTSELDRTFVTGLIKGMKLNSGNHGLIKSSLEYLEKFTYQ